MRLRLVYTRGWQFDFLTQANMTVNGVRLYERQFPPIIPLDKSGRPSDAVKHRMESSSLLALTTRFY